MEKQNRSYEDILRLNHIAFSYHNLNGETRAIDDISFSLKTKEFLAIVGPSGCGKSTLLNLICGLLKPENGEIEFKTTDKPNIGYMLQHDHLFEWRTLYDNLILGLEIQKKITSKTPDEIKKYAKSYGLESFLYKKPTELSGGMRQRAALIRTLLLNPDILLLDEPFSALDYQTRLLVSSDIGNLIRRTGKTAILVTHNLSEAISMADRVLVLGKRPCNIRKEFQIRLTIPPNDSSPLAYRNAPEFQNYFNQIWEELIHEA